MEYKILIKVFFPCLEAAVDVYIPTTRSVQYISILLQKHMQENYFEKYQLNPNAVIFNKSSGVVYEHNKIISDTDIRNGSKIVII